MAAVVHTACQRVYRDLSRWVGSDGTRALFARALAEARAEHPPLAGISVGARSEPGLEGISESIQGHGDKATAAALEALLVTLLGLLGRLIGDDMVLTLVEPKERKRAFVDGNADGRGTAT